MADHMPGIVSEHIHRFERIEDRLQSTQDKVGRMEAEMATIASQQDDIRADLYGNGQPGLRDTVRDFIKEIRTRDAISKAAFDVHNKTVSMKQNWLLIIATIIGVIVAYAQIFKHN